MKGRSRFFRRPIAWNSRGTLVIFLEALEAIERISIVTRILHRTNTSAFILYPILRESLERGLVWGEDRGGRNGIRLYLTAKGLDVLEKYRVIRSALASPTPEDRIYSPDWIKRRRES